MSTPLAIIVGATGGIGRAIAQHFVEAAWHVACCCRQLRDAPATPRWQPSPSLTFWEGADVTRPSIWWHTLCEAILYAHPGCRLRTVIVAHGAPPCITPFRDVSQAAWDTIQAVDVAGAVHVAQGVEPYLKASQGSLTLLSSMHAFQTYPQRAAYSVAKAGVVALARALAVEWGIAGVRVNAIAPGQVETPRSTALAAQLSQVSGQAVAALWRARSPMARLVAPEDVAKTAMWLAETPSVTGQTIVVDCGVTASAWYEPFAQEPC